MKNYACTRCCNKIYFENVQCLACGTAVGFDSEALAMAALEAGSAPGLLLTATIEGRQRCAATTVTRMGGDTAMRRGSGRRTFSGE